MQLDNSSCLGYGPKIFPPVSQKCVQKLETNWNNLGYIKVDSFRKSVNF